MAGPSGDSPDWAAIRQGYPAAIGRAYFDTACMGLPSPAAEAALGAHTAMLRDPPGSSTTDLTVRMLEQFDRARVAAAALIGAGRDEIALVPSTGAAIEAVASALQLPRGTHVLASDLEFVGTVLPWRLLEQRGISLRLVPHREGRVEVSDLEAAVDSHTRAVVVSSVQEVNGFRVDLDDLSRMCRSRGLLLIVDAIQHVGPLRLDVAATPVDAVAVGGHKWLCAPFGMGFLYTSPALLDCLEPASRSFMTARPPTGGWREYLEDPARRPDDPLELPAQRREAGACGSRDDDGGRRARRSDRDAPPDRSRRDRPAFRGARRAHHSRARGGRSRGRHPESRPRVEHRHVPFGRRDTSPSVGSLHSSRRRASSPRSASRPASAASAYPRTSTTTKAISNVWLRSSGVS